MSYDKNGQRGNPILTQKIIVNPSTEYYAIKTIFFCISKLING